MIFGAGDLAKETALLIRDLNQAGQDWDIQGCVVEDSDMFGSQVAGLPIIGGVEELVRREYTGAAVIAVGTPAVAYRIAGQIREAGLELDFPALVHPSAIADWGNVNLGKGVVIAAGCVLTTEISVGDFTIMNIGCTVAHDVQTGEHCIINPQANISGAVTLGDFAFIGSSAVVMDHKTVGEGAQVGIGAVVSTDVAPWTVMAGNPARVIKKLEPWARAGG